MTRKVFSAVALLLAFVPSTPAEAYVQARTDKTNLPMYWQRSCVELDILTASPPQMLGPDDFRNAAIAAATAWNPETTGCSAEILTITSSGIASHDVDADNVNTVQFRRDVWARETSDPMKKMTYDPSALALTSIFSVTNTGAIVDADVEVNAVNYSWTDVVLHPELASHFTHDLQNTLTHEFGHVLGLDHNCTSPLQQDLIDNTGTRAPACASAPQSITEATMFPTVTSGDTARRTLAADDILGVCTIYPENHKSTSDSMITKDGVRVCVDSHSGGFCAIAGDTPIQGIEWLVVGFGLCASGARAARRRRR